MPAPFQTEITIPALAKMLGVSRITIYKRVIRGDIPARKIGRMYVITDRTVRELLGKKVSSQTQKQIEAAVHRAVTDYGDLLKRLGKE